MDRKLIEVKLTYTEVLLIRNALGDKINNILEFDPYDKCLHESYNDIYGIFVKEEIEYGEK